MEETDEVIPDIFSIEELAQQLFSERQSQLVITTESDESSHYGVISS
jgi:hypothetical protein